MPTTSDISPTRSQVSKLSLYCESEKSRVGVLEQDATLMIIKRISTRTTSQWIINLWSAARGLVTSLPLASKCFSNQIENGQTLSDPADVEKALQDYLAHSWAARTGNASIIRSCYLMANNGCSFIFTFVFACTFRFWGGERSSCGEERTLSWGWEIFWEVFVCRVGNF